MKFVLLLALALPLLAQTPIPPAEQKELSEALAEAGNSSHEFIHVLEAHLKKYPDTKSRPELERAIVKSAIETKDNARIIRYGEAALKRDPDDVQTLEAITRALLAGDGKENAAKALVHANKLVAVLSALEPSNPKEKMRWQTRQEIDQTRGRALVLRARALGNSGSYAEAVESAEKAMSANPSAEAARERGKWLANLVKPDAAAAAYADAYVIDDARSSDAEKAFALAAMREQWRKSHADEKGLGDLLLAAIDRQQQRSAQQLTRLRVLDANALKTKASEFVLTGTGNMTLALDSLKGKVVILDFWATWCGPCRTQHPLYEKVREHFAGNKDVVFLAISTDEDRSLVEPFLQKSGWSKNVYFEDGLSRVLNVSSIPTTIILNRRGEVASRMNGFIPERFVDLLTVRVERILGE